MSNFFVHISKLLVGPASAPSAEPHALATVLSGVKSTIESLARISVVVGVLSILAYLSVSIHYFPAGISIGDTLLFLLIGVIFGLWYVFLTTLGFALSAVVSGVSQNILLRFFATLALYLLIFCLVFYGLITDSRKAELGPLFAGALLGFGVAGFGLFTLVEEAAQPTPVKPYMYGLLVLLLIPLFMASELLQVMNEKAMEAAGIRVENATLKLSDENYGILAGAAGAQYLAVLGCDAPPGASGKLVHTVTVLWHGLGERTLVEIPASAGGKGNGRSVQVELKREGVFIYKNYRGPVEQCIDLSADLLFENGKSILLQTGKEELLRVLKEIADHREKIKEILVVGHADPVLYKSKEANNNTLADSRAEVVRQAILTAKDNARLNVRAEGRGAREPKTLCKDWPVKATLAECLATNRRVELRIMFQQPDSTPDILAKPPRAVAIDQRCYMGETREGGPYVKQCFPWWQTMPASGFAQDQECMCPAVLPLAGP